MARKPGQAHQQFGATLGPRLAQIVSKAVHDHMQRTAHTRAKIGTEALVGLFRTMTNERHAHTKDFLRMLLGHDGVTPELERVLAFMADGQGELSELLGSRIAYGAIGTGLSSGIANLLAPINQELMAATPLQIPGPQEVAAMAAAGIIPDSNAQAVGERSGLNTGWMSALIKQARSYPGVAQLLDLHHRGLITTDDVQLALSRAGVPSDWHQAIIASGEALQAPADLALMVLKGITSETEAAGEAEQQGINARRFSQMVQVNGEPPGLMQLLEAFRRHIIDQHRLEHGVRQSRVRDEWMDVLLELRYEPASTSDAIRGVVQNHITIDEGRRIADENGLKPGELEWLVESAGNPPGPQQMLDLVNRGEMTLDAAKQGLRESRLKNKYIDTFVHLRRKLPEGRQVITMITRGAISEHDGAELLHKLGYDPTVVEGLIKSATSGQVAREKELAKAEVQELWFEKAISEDEAIALLKRLGYNDHNARLVVEMVNLKRETALRRAAMGPIRSAYIGRNIDETQARTDLIRIGIPHEQVELAIELWSIDRETHTKQLSEAQIVKANEQGLISDAQAEQRLMGIGYDHGDARLLLDMQKNRSTPAP